ncbi:Xaa-Pro aminopeptidase [Litorilituus lipolyticus]
MSLSMLSKLPIEEFQAHRLAFFEQMPTNSVAIIPANSEVTRSNDTEFVFCQDKNFYYLTGFNEPDALLVLVKNDDSCESVLFCLAKDELQEVWHGRRIGQEKAVADYKVEQAFTSDEIDSYLPDYLDGKSQVFFPFANEALTHKVFAWIAQVKSTFRQGGKAPANLLDSADITNELRLIKSDNELALMRQANVISGNAHQRAMQKAAVGKFEYQVEAEILHEFARNGARHAAYGTIVAGGDNANILHYTNNSDVLNDNELLLIDAGGELDGYAADITRTFPVNGRFTQEQKAIYQLVLDAKNLAVNAIKPGMSFAKLNIITNEFLTKGLLDLGILTGDLATLIEEKKVKDYFIHGLGHWLGLDVHDVGDYHANAEREQHRAFKQGMVMTIEPGIYIPLSDMNVEQKWRGIGVRIEDNIAVTATGYENLTQDAPDTIDAIEALMAKANS